MGIHLKITAEAALSLLGTEDTEIPEKSPCRRVAVSPCPRVPVSPCPRVPVSPCRRVPVVHYFSTPSIATNPSVMLYTACATIDVVVL
jgi:hypothetical protein